VIPKLIHFVWVGEAPMPDWAARNIESFRALNPGHQVLVHGGEALTEPYRRLYAPATAPSMQSDLLRLSALRTHGGWYWDVDFVPFRPLADLELAYGLDGRTMFISRQQGNRNPAWTHAAAPLACGPEWPGWPLLDGILAGRRPPLGYCDLGPRLFAEAAKARPGLFTVAEPQWCFPAAIGQAGRAHEVLQATGDVRHMRRLCRATGGQLPFAMHLWAANRPKIAVQDQALAVAGGGRRRAVLGVIDQQWQEEWQPFRSIAAGLARLGWTAEARLLGDPDLLTYADLLVVWNGRRSLYADAVARARALGLTVLHVEHGFFDRRRHHQVDHAGILHWAGWARPEALRATAPPGAVDRLRRVWPHSLPAPARRRGPALVVGQVDGDSQLDDCEVHFATELERMVSRVPGVQAIFRDHPLARPRPPHTLRLPRRPEASLADLARECSCAVMLNSNAGNELLAMGAPVLALGPALYLAGGVAAQWTPATLPELLQAPPAPAREAVVNYLAHLADRQYSNEELAAGTPLERILREAGCA